MKNQFILAMAFTASVLFSCKDKTNDPPPATDNTPQWTATAGTSDMMTFLNGKVPASSSSTMNSAIGGMVSSNGISVTLPADAFAYSNGSAFNGTVTLKMQTVKTIEDMIYSGVTTTANNGELLISGGMFKLGAYDSSSNELKLRNGVKYNAEFPTYDEDNIIFKGANTNGGNKIEWDEWDSTGVKRGQGTTAVFNLDKLFTFCNLDRYMNLTPLTDITVTAPAGFTNNNTECFIKYTGENASAYIPSNFTLKAFSTIGASYKVVQGKAAKIICFAKRDGKFYYDIQNIASIATNHALTISSMTETTESNLGAIIAAF